METMIDNSIEEIHEKEKRHCPTCNYEILNPLTDRCPRCFSLVPREELTCGECSHQGNCEFYTQQTLHLKSLN